MGWTTLFLVFFVASSATSHLLQPYEPKDDSPEELWKSHEKTIKTLSKIFEEGQEAEPKEPIRTREFNFSCPPLPRSDPKPTSVHQLRPGDFDVVAALGDSITAANGAKADNLLQVLIQARELSWSIGGDRSLLDGVLTLPNILRQYNPDLTGFSIGSSPDTNLNISRLNVAVPGARARHMPEQAEELIFRMKNWTDIDWENDWKIVTIFIGGNDLCACNQYSAFDYTNEIRKALDIMHAQMPRTFVNLAQTVDVTLINQLNSFVCDLAHLAYCECAKERWDPTWEDVHHQAREYHKTLHQLVQYGRYDTRDDFTVVIQPFFEETIIEEGNFDFVSPDCFHFSEYGHQMVAMGLWNNMNEPVGEKRTAWQEGDVLECPPEDFEYIYTQLNTPGYVVPTRDFTFTLPPTTPKASTVAPTLPSYDCPIPPPSAEPPTSVHELRPSDVDVLAALGDSITAGFGIAAETFAETGIQYRGLSWSIGGDNSLEEGTLTLTNVIRQYNPDVRGFSIETGSHTNHNISRLNVAVGGARARHMLGQTEDLIDRMKTYDSIDYENDWKVVTLFIGGNDLCAYCRDPEGSTVQAYTEEIKKALDLMHAEMPRTFVNLVQVLLVTEVNKLTGYCDFIHLLVCPCAKERWDENWEEVLDLAHDYHRALENLVMYGQYDTRDDFTVVIQPFYEETYIPWLEDENKWDDSLFSPDCFHFSEYGHQISAMSLWNNMNEPVDAKRRGWVPEDKLECPPEDFDYFYTYLNTPGYEVPTRGPLTTRGPTVEPTLPYPFECEILPPSDTIPTSAHQLRPADINVVAALGDSITAAFGAKAYNPIQVLIQDRGVSWSIGGDDSLEEGVLTLANVLRMYNPDLKGYSIDTGPHTNYEISRLNVAVGGARARHMLEQTEDLITRMKNYTDVDYDNDWKVITLFIGGNDLCACSNYSAAEYAGEIEKALDLMHAEIPRAFVNLAQVVQVTEINKLDGLMCDIFHFAYCECAKAIFNEDWADIVDQTVAYHRALEQLVESGKYDTREDFTVVLQPFFEKTYVPPNENGTGWDDSFFSPDCFHFSEFGHQMCGMSIWNNMIEPVGQKRTGWHPDDIVECPSEEFEYFYTYLNSPGYTRKIKVEEPKISIMKEPVGVDHDHKDHHDDHKDPHDDHRDPHDDHRDPHDGSKETIQDPVCNEHTGVLITIIILLVGILIVSLTGFIWLAMKKSSTGAKLI
ncbi:phospholipase B1, membrane-associated-like [Glandiceps talaboti]